MFFQLVFRENSTVFNFSAGGPDEDKAQFVFVPVRNSSYFKLVLLYDHSRELSVFFDFPYFVLDLGSVAPGTSNDKHLFKVTQSENHSSQGKGYHVLWSASDNTVISVWPHSRRLYSKVSSDHYKQNGSIASEVLAQFTPANLTLKGNVISFDFDKDPAHIEGKTQEVSNTKI